MNQCTTEYDESLGGWVIRDATTNELLCVCRTEEVANIVCKEIERNVF